MYCGSFQKEESLKYANLDFASGKLHPQNIRCIGNLFMKKLFANFILRSARLGFRFSLVQPHLKFWFLLFAVLALHFLVLDGRSLSKQWAELRESRRFWFPIEICLAFGGCEVKTIFPSFGIKAVTVRLIVDEVFIHFSEAKKLPSDVFEILVKEEPKTSVELNICWYQQKSTWFVTCTRIS